MLGVKPSFMTGFAQHAGESKYPELWQGLVGLWAPGLGPTGSQLFDFSKNSNIGVISGLEPDDYGVGVYGFGIYGAQGTPFYFVPSKQGYALYMDGTDSKVTIPAHPSIDISNLANGFTFSVLGKCSSGGSGASATIMEKKQDTHRFHVYDQAGSTLSMSARVNHSDTNANSSLDSRVDIIGGWHLFSMTYNQNTKIVTIYVDTIALPQTQITGIGSVTDDSADSLIIGNNSSGTRAFDGLIGIVMIHDRILKSSEMAFLAQNPYGLFEKFEV